MSMQRNHLINALIIPWVTAEYTISTELSVQHTNATYNRAEIEGRQFNGPDSTSFEFY